MNNEDIAIMAMSFFICWRSGLCFLYRYL